MKKAKIKMTFEVVIKFDHFMDEETFAKEYKNNITKLCKYMCKNEGIQGWYDEELKLTKAELLLDK